jgi:carboxymethylenebutenolidase
MDDESLKVRAIALHDRFTHGSQDRRSFMRDMTRLAGSATAAQVLVASIAASPAAATIVAEDDKRIRTATEKQTLANGQVYQLYMARPKRGVWKSGSVIVVHENRGLQAYTRDVARRLALAGFVGIAVDFLSPQGGTPADEDQARQMIGALDLSATTADGVEIVKWLASRSATLGKVGIVGFCWGGMMVDRIAVAAGETLSAGVAFYGPPPPPSEAANVKAAMLLHCAGTDDRVNAGAAPWVAALEAAHVPVTRYDYPGTQHAFHNDTSAARYDKEAANLAWDRTIAFFKEHLA